MNIGHLLIIGFDGTEMSPRLASLLTKVQPAGVILFGRNTTSAEQTHRLLRECLKCVETPLFSCVDLEGGKVDRFRNVLGPTPSAADVFATGNRQLFRKHGRIIGENCRALGFNVDFAPALDLAFEASRAVMSSRAVSDDPKQVVVYAREFLAGLREAGVLGCGKHFPGLGEGKLDTHHELPSIDKPLRKMWEEDLVPYRSLRRELPFVMVSHAAYPLVTGLGLKHLSDEGAKHPSAAKAQSHGPLSGTAKEAAEKRGTTTSAAKAATENKALTAALKRCATQNQSLSAAREAVPLPPMISETGSREKTPASLSKKWITDILRKKIGYRGLICSDDLEMGAVLAAAPIEQAAIGHIRAGGDLCLICHQEELVVRAYEAMIRQAERDRAFRRRVEDSARRVLAFKAKWKARNSPAPTQTKVERMERRLWEFGEQVRLATLERQERA